MTTVQREIAALEERLRQAELGPDSAFFEEALADEAVMVSPDGQPAVAKSQIVEAHRPGRGPKFTRVDTSDLKIIDHGTAAVVTCRGTYEGSGLHRYLDVYARVGEEKRALADRGRIDLPRRVTRSPKVSDPNRHDPKHHADPRYRVRPDCVRGPDGICPLRTCSGLRDVLPQQ